jgi:hypothetical protein
MVNSLHAQTASGTITVTVTYASGAVVSGATVTMSTFGGTHYVTPRMFSAELGFHF